MGFSPIPVAPSGTTDTTDSTIAALNAVRRLIQTQRIMAQIVLQGQSQ